MVDAHPIDRGDAADPVHRRFEHWAARTPEAPALSQGGRVTSYRELNERANRLAAWLAERGAGPEIIVGVCLPRGPELAVAALAVLKSGAAYLPLDPEHLSQRSVRALNAADSPLVLTTAEFAGALSEARAEVVDIAAVELSGYSPMNSEREFRPGDLAYVVFTSGSTGEPKGVLVEHGSLANLAAWDREAATLGPEDRGTLIASPGFDASVWELWPPLACGASLAVPDRETLLVPARLRDWLLREGITVAFLPTPLAERLIGLTWPADAPLRVLRTGGDRLHLRPAADLPFVLVNNYGPSENTVVATAGAVAPDAAGDALPSIGWPIAGTELRILDAEMAPVADGVVGEIFLSGPGLARGYLGRPDLTAERFVPDPRPVMPGARLYRTGDLGRRLPDGSVEFAGRGDDQVKIRGRRIEPGEVTGVLLGLPGVAAAHVGVHVPRPSADPELVAYVVPAGGPGDPATLRAELARALPDYLVPRHLVLLGALPTNASGKVDRRALPPVDRSAAPAAAERPGGSPSTDLERKIVAIWQELLHLDAVGLDDGFFELGGHSLLLADVHSRLCAEYGPGLPLVALFEHPTPRSLAGYLLIRGSAGEADPAAPPAQPAADTGSVAGQSRLGGRSRLRSAAQARRRSLAEAPTEQ
ncbi:non-ribosomal peptide synthetase [Streptomyces sp. NPDC048717]|uniref:non-ribosomal peptide synthetase n=1 Tax=Streptomyces sp. NPDC048717 TaxID=3154928 RepID=UPI00344A3D63